MPALLSRLILCPIAGLLLGAAGLSAQDAATRPSHAFVVTGYGTAGGLKSEDLNSTFFATVAPIFLFQFSDRVIAETELEFALEEGVTRTGLEYMNISILPTDNLSISAGKFLVPFGVFIQRLHPTWINRFVSVPPAFGHEAEIRGIAPLLPVIADIGVMASAVLPVGPRGQDLTFSAFATNGPALEANGGMGGMAGGAPAVVFGESAQDNNGDKMVGGRAGLVLAPNAEIDISAIRASYGDAQVAPNTGKRLGLYGLDAAGEFRRGRVGVRSEWLYVGVDAEEIDTLAMTSMIRPLKRWGGYVQASARVGDWEPVLRFSYVEPDTRMADDELTQYGVGLNYYITPSISIMAAFELNRDRFEAGRDLTNNRALIHWAFGF